jgi:protein-S-isoprenylcysteine O-methyltransferase Ste14
MLAFVRHLVSVALLPGVVVGWIPLWIARRYHTRVTAPDTAIDVGLVLLGCGLLAIGAALFASSLQRFVVEGHGTLAPWDPPRRLVVRGPYRYVRNPMISGVVFLLAAEAALLRSQPHALWALGFLVINMIYIPLLEEPMLAMRFGREFDEYRRHVRRFLPRLRPWHGRVERIA